MSYEWDLLQFHPASCLGTEMFRYPISVDTIQPVLRNHDSLTDCTLHEAASFSFFVETEDVQPFIWSESEKLTYPDA